ncbi:MAG: class I SAM-dependent methyltransferase [Clostridiales bacterium]|nr:class I SAM-dependent methyltransferase [Clostridiales bacterium]
MENRHNLLNDFYTNSCDEDCRLVRAKHSRIEFITTTKYIEKYLKKGAKILEVGAGTGRYSIYYAQKGYSVNSIEFIKHNIDILKNKITKDMNIVAEQGDALDLSRFKDNTFDMTLVLGPLYHLYNEKDQKQAISEAIRVTKQNGIIVIAYLTSDSIMVDWALDGHLIDGREKDFDKNFKMINYEEGIFAAFYIKEFKKMMEEFNVKYLKNIATDGMSHHMKEQIDKLTDEEFEIWVKYHLSTCEREDLQGYSNHMLYICQKN